MHGRQVELNLVDCSMLESVHVYELSFANLPHSVWRQFASHQATTWSPKAKVSKPWFLVIARRLPYLLYVFDNARGSTGLMFLSFIWKIWGFLSNHRCYSSNVLIDMYTLPQLCDTTRLFKIKLKVNPISNVFLQQTLPLYVLSLTHIMQYCFKILRKCILLWSHLCSVLQPATGSCNWLQLFFENYCWAAWFVSQELLLDS